MQLRMTKKKRERKDSQSSGKGQVQLMQNKNASTVKNEGANKTTITWALRDLDFRLVCSVCFIKLKPGKGGTQYIEDCAHNCSHDCLIIRLKNSPHLSWLEVRPRPASKENRFTSSFLKFCKPFQNGVACGTLDLCCSAHNKYEAELWAMDENGSFDIQSFVADARQRHIYSSDIPGLDIIFPEVHLQDKDIDGNSASSTQSKNEHAYHNESAKALPRKPRVDLNRFVRVNQDMLNVSSTVNPLMSECRIFCSACLIFSGTTGFYYHNPKPGHCCSRNCLAFQVMDRNGDVYWAWVRERGRHSDFEGRYARCYSAVSGNPKDCEWNNECHFYHNIEEMLVWQLEQKGQFSISEFISKHKNESAKPKAEAHQSNSLQTLVLRLHQDFRGCFKFICRNCYFEKSHISLWNLERNVCLRSEKHSWKSSKVLAHHATDNWTVIDERKFSHVGAFFPMCWFKKYCRYRKVNSCRFAHSDVEEAVWRLQQKIRITSEQLVQQSTALTRNAPIHTPASQSTSRINMGASTDRQKNNESIGKPPIDVKEICGTCWSQRITSMEVLGKDKCMRGHNNFKILKVFMSSPGNEVIRKLPGHLKPTYRLNLCKFHPKCWKSICGFPHGKDEMTIWLWMLRNEVKDLSKVSLLCVPKLAGTLPSNQSSSSAPNAWITVGHMRHHAWSHPKAEEQVDFGTFFCQICGTSCKDDKEWDEHCVSERHIGNVNSDKDHQWNFRNPPFGDGNNLDLCAKHLFDRTCPYSYVPDQFNLCSHAHSEEELEEWKQRYEWREMKRAMMLDSHVSSYTDALSQEYLSQGDSVNVLCEEIPGVSIMSKEDDVIYKSEKNDIFIWTFEIYTQDAIEKVALLHNRDRLHFHLEDINGDQHQVAPGDIFLDVDTKGQACYRVNVHFKGSMFGSFNQWIVFDFGSRPVLVRKLTVDIGDHLELEKLQLLSTVKTLRDELNIDRWTSENMEIIRCPFSQPLDPFTQKLLHRYKEPSPKVSSTSDSSSELNAQNYIHKMHQLLNLEEMTRQAIIASFSLTCEVSISQCVNEQDSGIGFYIGMDGDLFIKVPLAESLTTDSAAGKLVLSSVRTALIKRQDSTSNKVYEVSLCGENNYGFDGRVKECIYLVVHAKAAKELHISPGQSVNMEIQFQMDRQSFCKMHYAVDSLYNTDIVFPDITKFKPDKELLENMAKCRSGYLNEDQLAAVKHMVVPRTGYVPPFIMYGPFGTGKTESLATGIKALLNGQKEQVRILVCTHSNSAADLYILRYLHTFFKENVGVSMLRLIDQRRRPNTVPEEVQEFCYAPHGKFEIPSKEGIATYNLVLTTVETSVVLNDLDMQGAFTHIFIDEAGQITECEILMPLSLANSKTCVVLTGDHNQIGPTVYSTEARCQNFGMSLLERLFNYYLSIEKYSDKRGVSQLAEKLKQMPLLVFLRKNYRTREEILKFISSVFYLQPKALTACGNLPQVLDFPPMMFSAVQGQEYQSSSSVSYLNNAEAHEVVARVTELLDYWPSEWGSMDPKQVAVIATYRDQIKHIRSLLRQDRSRPHLRGVIVDSIQNFQGREVMALFITTVRTCHLLNEPHIIKALEAGEEIGDLGFLSGRKHLNTALTRTRAFVTVIGDPLALALIGDCSEIWRSYIKYCSIMGGILPASLTYEGLCNMTSAFCQGPENRILKLITEQHQQLWKPTLKQSTPVKKQQENGKTSHEVIESHQPLVDSSLQGEKVETKPDTYLMQPNGDRYNLSRTLNVEDIILFLASEHTEQGSTIPVSVRDLCLTSGKDKLVLVTKNSSKNSAQGGEEFKITKESEDFVAFKVEDNDKEASTHFVNWGVATLQAKLDANPTKFVKCSLALKSTVYALASVQRSGDQSDGLANGTNIEIHGSLNRGHAFDGDEVVVEVINGSEKGPLRGQVKGILERGTDPSCRLHVCAADPETIGVLIPMNTKMPPMQLLIGKKHEVVARKGHICVYKTHPDGRISFDCYAKVDRKHPYSTMFIVRYLFWPAGHFLPCAIVVGIIKNDGSIEQSMKILNLEHKIRAKVDSMVHLEEERVLSKQQILPPELLKNRQDLRGIFCFTVCDPEIPHHQMAISVKQKDSCHEVSLHVTDVAAFVDKGSALDHVCMAQSVASSTSGKRSQHLLPGVMATDLCNLRPNVDRLAVTVQLNFDGEGNPADNVHIFRSIINSKQQFTYQEVEQILQAKNEFPEEYFESCISVLDQLALIWREDRLGNGHGCVDVRVEQRFAPKSFAMMNELKLQFSAVIGQHLMKIFPNETPLLVQLMPQQNTLEVWRNKNVRSAMNTPSLTRAFLDNKVCTCDKACTCVFLFMRHHGLEMKKSHTIFKEEWNLIASLATEEDVDYEKLLELVSGVEPLPEVWPPAVKLAKLKQKSLYVCSNHQSSPAEQRHYDLNVQCCAAFDEPGRKMLHLATQRLLIAASENQPSPYSSEEMHKLCVKSTAAEERAVSLKQDIFMLQFCSALKSQPVMLRAVIIGQDTSTLTVSLGPHIDVLPEVRIELHNLPLTTNDSSRCQLSWPGQYYDCASGHFVLPPDGTDDLRSPVWKIPSIPWQRMLVAIRERKEVHLTACVQEILDSRREKSEFTNIQTDEQSSPQSVLQVQEGQPISVQLSAGGTSEGIALTPLQVQLVQFAPGYCVCLEHMRTPVASFIGPETHSDVTDSAQVTEIHKYVSDSLIPIVELESAHQAVRSRETLTLDNVNIIWSKGNSVKTPNLVGVFTLAKDFCERISFDPCKGRDLASALLDSTRLDCEDNTFCLDYVCVRHSGIPVAENPNLAAGVSSVRQKSQPITWIGHCRVVEVQDVYKAFKIKLVLVQSNMKFLQQLLEEGNASSLFTVEWISKDEEYRIIEIAARGLTSASTFVKDVFMARKPMQPVEPVPDSRVKILDESQERIISECMWNPFVAVVGGPGTGKSTVAACLSLLLVNRNSTIKSLMTDETSSQLMICGPTEESLDIITEFLFRFKKISHIVRVYSEEVEERDFPSSWNSKPECNETKHPVMRKVALHHIMRSKNKPHGKDIHEQEMLQQFEGRPTFECKVAIERAQAYYLRKSKVILCTCATSARPILLKFTNVRQIIVDDAGLIPEAETIVPLVFHKSVNQLVLFGDLKMPRRELGSHLACLNGYARPLLQRYADKARILNTQFRASKCLAAFTKHLFYSKLESQSCQSQQKTPARSIPWPNGLPCVFCHVHGQESKHGDQDSVVNEQEADAVSSLVKALTVWHNIEKASILVITATTGQAQLIMKDLDRINICTASESTGREAKYVIVSTVRSLPEVEIERPVSSRWIKEHVGRMANPRVVNLVTSRASAALFIIGNKDLLETSQPWHSLLAAFRHHKCIQTDTHKFLQSLAPP